MSGYVLVRTDGAYVTPSGSTRAYTLALQLARIFPTREAAEQDRCVENEQVLAVEDCLRGKRRA